MGKRAQERSRERRFGTKNPAFLMLAIHNYFVESGLFGKKTFEGIKKN
ncbi:MAG: hypothetical protein WC634_03995 [archaeon]